MEVFGLVLGVRSWLRLGKIAAKIISRPPMMVPVGRISEKIRAPKSTPNRISVVPIILPMLALLDRRW